uniref:O-fucosyltransferase family protein n=1 Tax=Heterorhabditis bacteriophora TaxID=37862 RepID=A0A1I7WIG6_HETBA
MPNFFSLRLLSLDRKMEPARLFKFLNFLVSSGFKSPSKATHNEWEDRIWEYYPIPFKGWGSVLPNFGDLSLEVAKNVEKFGMTSPYFLIFAPEAVQHLRAEHSRSVQNHPTPLPKERRELSKALKNREKNSPINLLRSEYSKLTVQVHRNLPLHRSTAGSLANSRNPHVNLFRTSAWFLLLNTRRSKRSRPGSTRRPPQPTRFQLFAYCYMNFYIFLYKIEPSQLCVLVDYTALFLRS